MYFSSMKLVTLFGKLQEHEMELKRLSEDKKGDIKNKILVLKDEEEKDYDSDKDMSLLVQ